MRLWIEKLSVCAIFSALYFLVFELSWSLDLVESYAPGISLIFLPAGIKLIAALVSGFWGVLGTVIALAYASPNFWPDQPAWFYVVYPCLSGFSTLFVVHAMKRMLGFGSDLRELKLLHIPIIDLCATLVHGVVVNGFFALYQLEASKDFITRAFAMSVGDFFGSLILLLSFALLARLFDTYWPHLQTDSTEKI